MHPNRLALPIPLDMCMSLIKLIPISRSFSDIFLEFVLANIFILFLIFEKMFC